ncbi:MAG TPA: efflux RND transporter periplasmic adaptor subunit [Deltaproteobacteria bacterium]|jgi:RND family efflux transporter MFP subunit|nr:efflux RND transporter periplasmic adaptor subunit [Deltaproteobacteria bacterium]HOI06875.1 efflux RND transporter periplasmic adaptor subunit [Deltaproteobacteria bacterium]
MEHQAISKGIAEDFIRSDARVKKTRRYDWIALVLLVLTLVVFAYAGNFNQVFTVNVTTVSSAYPYQMYTSLKADGKTVIGRTAAIAPRVPGQLHEVLVKRGAIVKKDQLIAVLENTEALLSLEQSDAELKLANANLEQASIALSEAEASHEHNSGLYASGALSSREHSASETQLRKARSAHRVAQAMVRAQEAALRRAELNLGYTHVRAPFDGIVLSVKAHAGDMVRPLATEADEEHCILTLADAASLAAQVEVPLSERERITVGQPCEIILQGQDRTLKGEVETVMSPTDKAGESVVVRVSFIDRAPTVLPDMDAHVAFLVRPVSSEENKPLVTVDRSALNPCRGGYSVFKVSGERAVEKLVRLGRQFKDKVEVLEGVRVGDVLVANPPDGLKHGSKVIPRKG